MHYDKDRNPALDEIRQANLKKLSRVLFMRGCLEPTYKEPIKTLPGKHPDDLDFDQINRLRQKLDFAIQDLKSDVPIIESDFNKFEEDFNQISQNFEMKPRDRT